MFSIDDKYAMAINNQALSQQVLKKDLKYSKIQQYEDLLDINSSNFDQSPNFYITTREYLTEKMKEKYFTSKPNFDYST